MTGNPPAAPQPATPPPGTPPPAMPPAATPAAAEHPEARLALGALVLGALEPTERAAVELHVAGCAECSAELVALAVLPGLLGRLSPAQAAAISPGLPDPAEPPAELLERVLARGPGGPSRPAGRSARPGRRRRLAAWSGAAVAALAGIGWLVAGPLTGPGDEPGNGTGVVVVQGRDAESDVRAELTLSPTPNGTELAVALAGVRPGEDCQLIAWTDDGRKEVASSWRASYQGAADVTGSTSLPLAEIAGVTIKTLDGRRLLTLNLPD